MTEPLPINFPALAARLLRAATERTIPPEASRAAERRRLEALIRTADERNVPREEEVRDALQAPGGLKRLPFVAAVDEALSWARPHGETSARRPAVRVLLSDVGCGKTCALSHGVIAAPRLGRYVTAPEIAVTHRAMHDNRAAWAVWTNVDVLAIDELGMEDRPDVVAELMLARWTAGGVTLGAGNMTRDEARERYLTGRSGRPLTDRLTRQSSRGLRAFVAPDGLVSLRTNGAV